MNPEQLRRVAQIIRERNRPPTPADIPSEYLRRTTLREFADALEQLADEEARA